MAGSTRERERERERERDVFEDQSIFFLIMIMGLPFDLFEEKKIQI